MEIDSQKVERMLHLISDTGTRTILNFLRKEKNYVSKIAEETGIPETTVWIKIKGLLNAEIVKMTEEKIEGGRKVKMYEFINVKIGFKDLSELLDSLQ